MTLQTVHLRINDAATGRPTPVRLRVTDAAGAYCPPFGRPAEFAHGPHEDVGGNLLLHRDRWTYIDGTCEVAVPPGDITVEASKGPEYRPLRHTTFLPAGKMSLRLAIERWTDLRAESWYSGDTRAHSLAPHAALLEAAAEDLAVVNLLACQTSIAGLDGHTYTSYPNMLAFSGQKPCLERDGHQVVVGTHNRHPVLGKLGLLNTHRAIFPLTFGGPDATDDWSVSDWCDQCHRKGGLAVWTAIDETSCRTPGEAMAAAILGKIDVIEMDASTKVTWQRVQWVRMQNAGIPIPLVAASGKDSNRSALGALRTYAHIPSGTPYSYGAWIEAVRAGHTFVTGGPLLRFTVDGAVPGESLLRSTGDTIHVSAEALGLDRFESLEIRLNGGLLARAEPNGNPLRAIVELDLPIMTGGWIAAQTWGDTRAAFAQTSPVRIFVQGHQAYVSVEAVTALVTQLERSRDWVEREAQFTSDKARAHLLAVFDAARQTLLARAGPSGTIDSPVPPSPLGDDG
jgi:hypothetical protein